MKLLVSYCSLQNAKVLRKFLAILGLYVFLCSQANALFAVAGSSSEGSFSKGESVSFLQTTNEQVLAFPGADGWGRYTTGGRGGNVMFVTNLNDKGEGSLRAACEASGARTVIFKVSGTIELKSTLRIRNDNITIAGQTAPGDGITIKGRPVDIRANNVIIRYIRFRMGDSVEDDAFKGTEQKNIIIDHCTMSWGVDEVASFYRNENFTLQNCIVAESLYRSIHTKGDHGYGGIWGGKNASFLRNLIAHHTSRTPRFNGARYLPVIDDNTDFRNNVIYNWGFNNVYGGDPNEDWGTKATINVVNNFYKPGPATNSGQVAYRVVEPSKNATFGYSRFHVEGNEVFNKPEVLADNWALGVQSVSAADKETIRSVEPFEHVISETLTASDAYEFVLDNAGVRIPGLDVHELRVIEETRTGTATFGGAYKGVGTGIIDSPADVGGWPELFSAPSPADSDSDGMPDLWELANNLDPNNADDRNADMLGEGYTNLEYYLNNIGPATGFVRPVTNLNAELTNITQVQLTWIDNAVNETGFYVERKVSDAFETIAVLPANTTIFTDSLLNEQTTYTYRIVAFSETDSSVYSNTASATTFSNSSLPQAVVNPYPANNSNNVSTLVGLAWSEPMGADTYDVYFGETTPPAFVGNQSTNNFQPEMLPGRTYFWRVEAVNQNGKTNNNKVWTFTVREKLASQMVGHWSLDSYSSLLDSSVFENHGTAVNVGYNASLANAPVGRAIKFDGSSQYIEIPHSYEFDFENDGFTLAFWLRADANIINESKPQPYIFKGITADQVKAGNLPKSWEVFSVPAENRMVFQVNDGTKTAMLEAPVAEFINGNWVYVIAIRNKNENMLSLYANGVLLATADDQSTDVSQNGNLYFAHRPVDNTFARASIDDVKLFNYVLSLSELYQLMDVTRLKINSLSGQLEVYPNPAQNYFSIKLPDTDEVSGSKLHIMNALGQVLKLQSVNSQNNNNELIVETGNLLSGTYFLHLTTAKASYISKLIIVR
ncbi:MAG TPA: T9SS type A sorting domain-containing protein [Prolixibacteraceae bacterium]|nr:T9SS type A sorting domain-containing protein [Prolixibacteraceae bacterium]